MPLVYVEAGEPFEKWTDRIPVTEKDEQAQYIALERIVTWMNASPEDDERNDKKKSKRNLSP